MEKEARHVRRRKAKYSCKDPPRKKGFQKRKSIRSQGRGQQQEGKTSHVFLSKSILNRIECGIQRPTAELKVGAQDSRHITPPAALLARPGQSRDS